MLSCILPRVSFTQHHHFTTLMTSGCNRLCSDFCLSRSLFLMGCLRLGPVIYPFLLICRCFNVLPFKLFWFLQRRVVLHRKKHRLNLLTNI